jgi:small-conductance mechanosensitive channel
MQMLDSIFWGNTVQAWLTALGIGAVVVLVLRVVVTIAIRRLRTVSERTRNDIDDIFVDILASTKPFFLVVLGFWAATRFLVLPANLLNVVRWTVAVVVVFQVAAWSNVAITALIRRRIEATVHADPAEATTMAALGFLIRLLVWTVLILAALDNLGIEIAPLLAGLGIGGIAIALAVQNVLGDLFASLSIVLDKPFVIGDFIVVGDMAGTIENVGLKTTRVRSLSGEQLVFANSDLLDSRIRNYKRMFERRNLFTIGVTYQTPRDQLQRIPTMIREIVESIEAARFDRSHFKSYGNFSIDFETVYFVRSPEYNVYMDVQQDINLRIHEAFENEGIEFAYPTQTLFIENGGSVEDRGANGREYGNLEDGGGNGKDRDGNVKGRDGNGGTAA